MFRRITTVPESLRASRLASRIPVRELEALSRLGTAVPVAAGRHAMIEDRIGRECMVVVEGAFDVARDGVHVATLGVGDVMGEVALLTNRPRNATVTATEDSLVFAYSRGEFRSLLRTCPVLATEVRAAADQRTPAAA